MPVKFHIHICVGHFRLNLFFFLVVRGILVEIPGVRYKSRKKEMNEIEEEAGQRKMKAQRDKYAKEICEYITACLK